jgi:protein-tyrosine-phosphatase
MAAGLLRRRLGADVFVDSCGVQGSEAFDPFVVAVMAEAEVDLSTQRPKTFDDVGADGFDLIVCLSPEAYAKAAKLSRSYALDVEVWDTEDPTTVDGARDQRLNAYRRVRDALERKIASRFG